jgi:serine/threonine protein kinase
MASADASGLPEALAKAVDVTLNKLEERYTLGELIGEGRFSQVFSAKRVANVEGEVALKVMELGVVTVDDEALEMLEAETSALRLASEHERLRHRVVRLHEVILSTHHRQRQLMPTRPPAML